MKTEDEDEGVVDSHEIDPEPSGSTVATADVTKSVHFLNLKQLFRIKCCVFSDEPELKAGPEYFQFQCTLCGFDVRARYSELKIGKLEYVSTFLIGCDCLIALSNDCLKAKHVSILGIRVKYTILDHLFENLIELRRLHYEIMWLWAQNVASVIEMFASKFSAVFIMNKIIVLLV